MKKYKYKWRTADGRGGYTNLSKEEFEKLLEKGSLVGFEEMIG